MKITKKRIVFIASTTMKTMRSKSLMITIFSFDFGCHTNYYDMSSIKQLFRVCFLITFKALSLTINSLYLFT